MIRESLRCPACGSLLDGRKTPVGKAFRCPACREQLRVTFQLGWTVLAASILLSWILSEVLGMRGLAFFATVLLGWIPIWFGIRLGINFVLPPRVERYQSDLSFHFTDKPRP
jgi:hypothetical protein